MSRPTDWTSLEHHQDPVPGNWSEVKSAATRYGNVAESIRQAKADLLRVFEDEELKGDAIDAMRETALDVADRIGRANERYQGVSNALAVYAEPLRSAQDRSLDILGRADPARTERDTAQHQVDYWEREHTRLMWAGDPEAEEARQKVELWRRRYYDAHNDIIRAIAELNGVISDRDAAAETAANAIELVENTGDLNDGFWDNVDQFLAENPWVDTLVTWAGYIAAALAIIAMFVPGLNLLVLIVSIAVAAAVVTLAWAKASTGRISVLEAIITTVLAVIPFGLGKVFGSLSGKALPLLKQAAVTSRVASASGSGISGVTRPVALEFVEAALTSNVGVLRGATDVAQLVNVSTLAKTVLFSGASSAAVAQAARPVLTWMYADIAVDVVSPTVDIVLAQTAPFADAPTGSMRDENW